MRAALLTTRLLLLLLQRLVVVVPLLLPRRLLLLPLLLLLLLHPTMRVVQPIRGLTYLLPTPLLCCGLPDLARSLLARCLAAAGRALKTTRLISINMRARCTRGPEEINRHLRARPPTCRSRNCTARAT